MGEVPATAAVVRPSVRWYAVGIVLLLVGAAAAMTLVVQGFTGMGDPSTFRRVPVPGEREVVLDAGEHLLFAEYAYLEPYGGYADPYVTVIDAQGREVVWAPTFGGQTYWHRSSEGREIGVLDLRQPGTYRIVTEDGGSEAVAVTVGSSVVPDGGSILTGLALGVLFGLLGLAALVVVGVRRGKAKRALRPATAPGAWSGGPGWGPPPGAWGPSPGAWGAPQPGGWGAPPPGAWGAPPPGSWGSPQPGAGPWGSPGDGSGAGASPAGPASWSPAGPAAPPPSSAGPDGPEGPAGRPPTDGMVPPA